MGIYGHAFSNNYMKDLVIVELEDLDSNLNESNVQIGQGIELYIRDAFQMTTNQIKNDNNKPQGSHGSSIKVAKPKDAGLAPIILSKDSIKFDPKTFKGLDSLNKTTKKTIVDFLEKNQEDLKKLWNGKNNSEDLETWKRIIDRSPEITKITSVNDDIKKYFKESKKKG